MWNKEQIKFCFWCNFSSTVGNVWWLLVFYFCVTKYDKLSRSKQCPFVSCYFCRSPKREPSGLDWVLCSGPHVAKIRVSGDHGQKSASRLSQVVGGLRAEAPFSCCQTRASVSFWKPQRSLSHGPLHLHVAMEQQILLAVWASLIAPSTTSQRKSSANKELVWLDRTKPGNLPFAIKIT